MQKRRVVVEMQLTSGHFGAAGGGGGVCLNWAWLTKWFTFSNTVRMFDSMLLSEFVSCCPDGLLSRCSLTKVWIWFCKLIKVFISCRIPPLSPPCPLLLSLTTVCKVLTWKRWRMVIMPTIEFLLRWGVKCVWNIAASNPVY